MGKINLIQTQKMLLSRYLSRERDHMGGICDLEWASKSAQLNGGLPA